MSSKPAHIEQAAKTGASDNALLDTAGKSLNTPMDNVYLDQPTTDKLIGTSIEKPASDRSTAKPTEKLAEISSSKAAENPVGKFINKITGKVAEKTAKKAPDMATDHSPQKPIDPTKHTETPMGTSTSSPTPKPITRLKSDDKSIPLETPMEKVIHTTASKTAGKSPNDKPAAGATGVPTSQSEHPAQDDHSLRKVASAGSPRLKTSDKAHEANPPNLQRPPHSGKPPRSASHDTLLSSAPVHAVPNVTDLRDPSNTTILLAGTELQPFYADSTALLAVSPYFTKVALINDESSQPHPTLTGALYSNIPTNPVAGPFSFPEFDEFAMALFTRWLHDRHSLHGPHSFHSLNHYLSLYALAHRFEIEPLQDQTIDLVRDYYRAEHMTAPAFRLDYIYHHTAGPNKMKEFLVATAAYRALSKGFDESDSVGYTFAKTEPVSDSLREVLRGGGDVAVDFAETVVGIVKADMEDPRHGDPRRWHVHSDGASGTEKPGDYGGEEAWEKR